MPLFLKMARIYTKLAFIVFYSSTFCTIAVASDEISELREIYSKPQENWPKAHLDEGINALEIGRLPKVEHPDYNKFSEHKANLGAQLFHDPRLSRSGQIACASCHDTDLGWADGRKTSFGHNRKRGKRNAPSIENVAFGKFFFWDGRATTLEQQALMPIVDPVEMNFSMKELVTLLSGEQEYKKAFTESFGDSEITAERIGQALATFQRTITSRRSDFDRFLMAREQKTERMRQFYQQSMSDKAVLGLHLFRTKARCMNCHNGPTFSDNKFHNIGLTYYRREYQDLGRYNVTGNPEDVGKFRTPSLRGVMNTKPWMHNGLFADMAGIMNIYNAGGFVFKKDPNDPLSPVTSTILKPLNLTEKEIQALIAFMQAITAYPAISERVSD